MSDDPDMSEHLNGGGALPGGAASPVVVIAASGQDAAAERLAGRLPEGASTVVLGAAEGRTLPDGARLLPGTVFAFGAGCELRFDGERVFAAEAALPPALAAARAFHALAAAHDERSVAILLAPPGAEEHAALADVFQAGGLSVVALAGSRASGDGAAIGNEILVVEPDEVADLLAARAGDRLAKAIAADVLDAIRAIVAEAGGKSFLSYKREALGRRVQRRMTLSGETNEHGYLARLRADAGEVSALRRDLLIGVTRFFRDREVFDTLARTVIPDLVRRKADDTIRIWVPAAATGEEAYSYAILFAEEMARQGVSPEVMIFATDLDEDAIVAARTGFFGSAVAADLPAGVLARHFEAVDGELRIARELRQMMVFAVQDLLVDPPFNGLDLVSCRNLLIYLEPSVQPRVLDILHFALAPGGVLVLGASEAVGRRSTLFEPVSSPARIYVKTGDAAAPRRPLVQVGAAAATSGRQATPGAEGSPEGVRRALLDAFVPPSVVIDRLATVRYFHGPVRRYLAIPVGEPTTNLLELVGEPLRQRIRGALARVALEGVPATVAARAGDGDADLVVTVRPLKDGAGTLFLVVFEEPQSAVLSCRDLPDDDGAIIGDLEDELAATRENLQSTIEQLESTNEELKASNEEVISSNDELQRANAELETSRVELESLNGALSALNAELGRKVAELTSTNDDLANLLASNDVATLFLGADLRLRRYTPRARELLGVGVEDLGRELAALRVAGADAKIVEEAADVLERLRPSEEEVSLSGRWLLRRVVPYRTAKNVIAGVVVTFADVTALKITADRLARRERQQAAVAALGEAATGEAAAAGALLDRVVGIVAEHLDVPLAKVLELRPGGEHLLLRAGVGWEPGLVGAAEVSTDHASQAGYTLRSRVPVIVADLAAETRFSGPQLLRDHGVASGLSVNIGPQSSPWGVLGAHTTVRRDFSVDDVNFVQAVANVVWATIERQRVARAYRVAAERLELAVSVGGLATWEWELATGKTVWSEGHYTIFGYRKKEVHSSVDVWRDRVHPEDLPLAEAAIAKALEGDGQFVCEYRVIPAKGVERWVEGRGRTLFDASGQPIRMFGVVIDVTERKRSEERQSILLHELDHRVRNILANITALARQTRVSATTVASYVADFTGRLGAIARAHTLLSETRWHGASLATLVGEELEAYRGNGRITIDGPDVSLGPDDAQLFAMAFHELALNASRYGALRSGEGALTVRWSVETVDGEEALAIEWRERVTTPVEAPRTEGFGSLVLSRLLPMQTGGRLALDYRPEGLACRILLPRDRIDLVPLRAGAPGAQEAAPAVSLAGLRILVVEDSMLTALDIEAMLRTEGANVAGIAATLGEAEARLARGGIDAALVDRNLGGTLVDDFARALGRAGVPFVFMTGYTTAAIPADLRDRPVLSKPFETETLLEALADIVPRGAAPKR